MEINANATVMINVECHITIKQDGISFLTSAKTELLLEIIQQGSLSNAAKMLKISYQHAWTMVSEMNHAAHQPVVVTQRGGTNGGGTEISPYGKKILLEYQQIEMEIIKVVNQINADINF